MNRLDELLFKLRGKFIVLANRFDKWLEDFMNGK